jgi:trafficking protein particle complex subunit 10
VPNGQLQQQQTRALSPPPTAPGDGSQPGLRDTLSPTTSIDARAGNPAQKERRHQIPGLRQTPYLKVYLLRCDDNDIYKATSRKLVREWIKDHTTQPTQNTGSLKDGESHDAFEWMIIHVVLPHTLAANQPRSSTSSGSGPQSEKSGASRWVGKGSSTLLDKIKSDFNGSTKTSKDRVAQIRLAANAVPQHLLPDINLAPLQSPYVETLQEQDGAWSELISKFKQLILYSFDMRVSQYEEDVYEKDQQRALPGWNFCTFFVLKEGLARGFESVGLIDDALVGYDELGVGLESIVREQAVQGGGDEHGGRFLDYTRELWRDAEHARTSDAPTDYDNDERLPPLSEHKKPYRELILSNNISVFDFRCYLFCRQSTLLLRLGNASSSVSELMSKLQISGTDGFAQEASTKSAPSQPSSPENLMILAEVCKRGIEFVTSGARIMRADLWKAHSENVKGDDGDREEISQIIDNLVSSWTFSVSQQILAQTATKALPTVSASLADTESSTDKFLGQEPEQKVAINEPKTMVHPGRHPARPDLPARQSSMPNSRQSQAAVPMSPNTFPSHNFGDEPTSPPPTQAANPGFLKAGLEDLAAYRAELYLLGRGVLEHLGRKRGWFRGWAELASSRPETDNELEEISLEDSDEIQQLKSEALSVLVGSKGIDYKMLKTAIEEKDAFYKLYEKLTDKAMGHYSVAKRDRSFERMMADLAVLKFHLEDYATAATYFHRMAPFYADGGWAAVETSLLMMYARCLRQLNNKKEYVNTLLKLLTKAAARELHNIARRNGDDIKSRHSIGDFIDDDLIATEGYVEDLLKSAKDLDEEVPVLMSNYFADISVDSHPVYHPDKDGFKLQLKFRYLLEESLPVRAARVRIVSTAGGSGREIWLQPVEGLVIKRGINRTWVETNVSAGR